MEIYADTRANAHSASAAKTAVTVVAATLFDSRGALTKMPLGSKEGTPTKGLMLRCVEDWSILVHVRPTIPLCTIVHCKNPERTTYVSYVFRNTGSLSNSPMLFSLYVFFVNYDNMVHTNRLFFSGCFPFGNHTLIVQTRNRIHRGKSSSVLQGYGWQCFSPWSSSWSLPCWLGMLHPRVKRSKWRMVRVHQRPRRHLGWG